jgi:conjugative transfer region protein TrbK
MEGRTGKIAVTAAIVGLIVAASIAMGWGPRSEPPPATTPAAPPASADVLNTELERCNRLGPADKPDQACLDAWAVARRRFFGGRP